MGIKDLKLPTKRLLLTTIGILVAVSALVFTPVNSYAATPAVWSVVPSADETKTWRDITWSSELKLFVAVGANCIMTSSDGLNWTPRTSPAGSWASVAWSPEIGKFVAVGIGSSSNMMYSSDGINWATAPVGANALNAITWSPEQHQFVAVGIGTPHSVAIDINLNATPNNTAAISGLDGVAWSKNDNAYVAVAGGSGPGRTYKSGDGVAWGLNNTTVIDGPWTDITYADDQDLFVIVGTNGIMTSSDGVVWTAQPSALTNLINVTYSPENHEFVAIGNGGIVQTSPNGTNWTTISLSTTNNWRGITWSPELSRYVGVASAGTGRVLVGLVPKISNAPLNLTATSSDGIKANLSWTVPSFDGNSAITGYRIERSANSGNFTTLVTNITGTTFEDTGLDSNVTYKYRVFAINAMGESAMSNEATLIRTATLAETGVSIFVPLAVAACAIIAGGFIAIRRLHEI